MSLVKTIKISDDIHSRLLKIGSMGETFEDVIRKLLDSYESKTKKWVSQYFAPNVLVMLKTLP